MTSPFRFDGRTIPETEEERRKRLLREAMEAAQFGQTFAAGGQPQRSFSSSVLDEANQERENVTRSFLAALEESKRRQQSPLARLAGMAVEPPAAADALPTPPRRRPQPTIEGRPEIDQRGPLANQYAATVSGITRLGLNTAARAASALDALLPEPLESGAAPTLERMSEQVRRRMAPPAPMPQALEEMSPRNRARAMAQYENRQQEYESGILGAEMAGEFLKYGGVTKAALAVPGLVRALGRKATAVAAPTALGAVEDIGTKPELSLPSLLAQGARATGFEGAAQTLEQQAETPYGRAAVGGLVGLIPDVGIESFSRLMQRGRGAVRPAAQVPTPTKTLLTTTARTAAGGLAGAAVGDTPEERAAFGLAGATGAAVAPSLIRRLVRPAEVPITDAMTKRLLAVWDRANPKVEGLAAEFMGGEVPRPLSRATTLDIPFTKRIADWYDSAASDPTNPEVQAAYRAFADETRKQYDFLRSKGIAFEFVDTDPYKRSAEMMQDVADNNRLKVLKTQAGMHPLLTEEENDMFRAVHDFFGHAKEGHQFGQLGEENAYRVHSAMYSPEARRVMATETRGQNSWVNNQPANLKKPGSVYAEQKVALMPDEFIGQYPIERVTPEVVTNVEYKSEAMPGFRKEEFKALSDINRRLGRAAFMRKVVEPIVKSENLPVTVAKGLGSWLAESDPGITEAARLSFSQMSPMAIQRVLARVSQAAKQMGAFFAVPNPSGPNVSVTLDFGRTLKEPEYRAAIERLSAADNGRLFDGTTMVKLDPAKVQIVLKKGIDEQGAESLLSLARQVLPQYNSSGTVQRVMPFQPGSIDNLDEAFAEYFASIGYLTPEQAQAQQRAVTAYEQLAQARPARRALAAGVPALAEAVGDIGVAGLRRAAEMASRPAALAAGRGGIGAVIGLALTPAEAGAQGQGEGGGLGLPALLAGAAIGVPQAARSQFATRLFSRLGRAIDAAPFEKGTPQQWQAALSKGVAAGEREFTGIDEFLASTDAKTLTKAEIRDAFKQGEIQLGERVGSEASREQMQALRSQVDELGNARAARIQQEVDKAVNANPEIRQLEEQVQVVNQQHDAIVKPSRLAFENATIEAGRSRQKYAINNGPLSGSYNFIRTLQESPSVEEALRRATRNTADPEAAILQIAPEDLAVFEAFKQADNEFRVNSNTARSLDFQHAQLRSIISELTRRVSSEARDSLRGSPELQTIDDAILDIERQVEQYRVPAFSAYTQPGNQQNYREVLLTLDGQEVGQSPYRSAHWGDVENPLLHVRMSDRQLPDGQKALFVEEIQSDWHQAGRKGGYVSPRENFDKQLEQLQAKRLKAIDDGNERELAAINQDIEDLRSEQMAARAAARDVGEGRVPDAPFKKTQEWTELGLKRVIDEAVQGGYDRVVLVTGQQAADNFDLSRRISRLDWNTPDNGKTFELIGNGGELANDVPLTKLPDYVGKDIADKIASASTEQRRGVLQGVDLKVGGEGMRAFYDKLVPNTLRDLGKSMGLKIELEPVNLIQGRGQNLSFRITPEAREKVMTEGMRLYDITGVAGAGLRQAATSPAMGAAVGAGVGALTDEEDRFGGAMRGAFVGAGVGTAGKITAQQLLRARAALKASGFPQELAEAYARASASIDFSGKAAQALARRAKGSFKQMAQRALAGYEDGVRALDRLAEGAEAVGMAPERSVATALDRALGSQATAARALANGVGVERGGVIDPITREIVNEPLEDVFKVLGGRPETNEQALTYVVALRRLGRYDKAAVQSPEAAAVVYGGDLATMEADRAVVAAFGERPEFVEFAGRLQQYLDAVGEYMVKSGVWSPAQYAAMRESDAFYIPFKRLLENVQATVGRPMKAGVTPGQVTAGVKTFTGSRLALANPAEALGEYTAAAIARADKYRVGSALIDTVNELGDTSLLTRIEATDPRARGVAQADAEAAFRTLGISEDEAGTMAELFRRVDKNNPVIWRNGPEGREYYLVNDPDLVNALETLNPENPGAAVRAVVGVLSPLKRATTAFATGYSPSFWLGVNLPRDIITAYAQNPNMTIGDMAVGFKEAFKSITGRSEMVDRITREGAGQVSQFGAEPDVAALMRGIAPTTAGQQVRSTVGAGVTAPLRGLERVGRATEMPMRLASARAAERTAAARGVSEAGQRALGSRAYSRATVDFRRKAGVGLERFFEQTVPFYGAAKKGGVAFARAAKNNPKAVSAAATAVVLGASLEHILGGGTMGGVFEGDEAARQEQTNRLAWERARSIQLGDFKLALPQELAVVAAATRVALASLERDDPFAYQQLQESLLSAIPPIYSDLARGEVIAPFPVVRQLQEIAQNRSAFTGRPIVPESMTGAGVGRGVLPEQRRYPTTSPTFDVMAAAARGLGFEEASPLQAEYLMRGITGRFTPAVTALTDVAAQPMTGRETQGRVRESFMRQPLNPLSSFVVQPSRRTQAEEEFYQLRNEIEAAQGTYSRLDRQYQTAVERNDAAGEERVKQEITRMRKDPRFKAVWQNTGARLEDKRAANPEYQTAFDKLKLADELLEDVRTQQELVQEAVANRRMSQAEARKRLDQLNLERSKVYRRAFDVLSQRK